MKTWLNECLLAVAVLAAGLVSHHGADVAAPVVIERGPHHRVVRSSEMTGAGDGVAQRRADIVELESGMHRWDGQTWVEVSPTLRIANGKAVADLFYSVEFAANLATRGAISISLPDGNRLTMHVLGLAYVDGQNSIMIAEVKDCAAEIGGANANEITYRDAFTDFPIDCKFTVRKGSLSQHIWIRSALPPPTEYGLSEQAFLEVFTEFIEHPPGTIEPRRWRSGTTEHAEIMDEKLSFGSMEFITGKAFFSERGALEGEVPVSKAWSILEGRTFLRERIPFADVKAEIQKLPVAAAAANRPKRNAKLLAGGFLPPRREARPPVRDIQLAAARTRDARAYVVDWETAISADLFTWKANVTHYIAGAITVKTNIFEGGTVIKLAPTNSAKLTITGPVTNYASQYRPVTFTARDDHTIGEAIGSDAVSGYYGAKALELDWYTAGATFNLEHFRFRYAQVGVHFNGGLGNVLSHAQFVNCSNAVEQTSSDLSLRNALIHRANNAFAGNSGSTNRGEHLTVHEVINHHVSGNPALFLTNSLLVAVTNVGTYSGLSNQTATAVGGGFQTVGAGQHYLTNNSVWRDAGTANVNADLLAYLRRSTTYPPTLYSNYVLSSATVFTPQATRDTNAPDLGYHAAPLDYAASALSVSNCVLTVTNGVAIGGFGVSSIRLRKNAELTLKGLATEPVQVTRYTAVQEQPILWGLDTPAAASVIDSFWTNGVAPILRTRFTTFDLPASGGYHVYGYNSVDSGYTNISIRDCQFSGANVYLWEKNGGRYAFTNNVFERVDFQVYDASQLEVRNNNFAGVSGWISQTNVTASWSFKDNLVDGCSLVNGTSNLVHEYNAYHQSTAFYSIYTTNATEKGLSALSYQRGVFGRWYQPSGSELINAGSASSAGSVGFYWYCTTTNNAAEENSALDIGYHSVALNSSSQPWDTNGDGTPNYMEDLDGDGLSDPNELSGLKLWLKADAGVTNDASDRVSGWADQSGNNNHGSQTTAANKPLYVANVLNGKPVIRFDGTNYYFSIVSFLSGLSQAEIFVVLRASNDVPATSKSLWKMGPSSSAFYPSSEGRIGEDFGSSSVRTGWDPFQPLNEYHVYSVSAKSGEWISRLNGIIYVATTNNTVSFPSTIHLGKNSSSFFHGDVAELFCYNRVISTADREALGSYLNSRYPLVGAAPSAPTTLSALALSPTQISVAWLATLGNQKLNFKAERKAGASGTYSQIALIETSCSFIDTNLTPSTEYYYRVKASNYAGDSGYSSETNATTFASGSELPLANLKVWYKADAGRGATNIGSSYDQSGNGNHASQTTQNKMPIVSTNAQNGRPMLKFDGSNDQFDLPNFLPGFTEAEAYVVLRAEADVPASSKGLWRFGSSTSTHYPQSGGGHVWDDFFSTSVKQTGNPTQALDQCHLLNVSSKEYDWALMINGLVHYSTNVNSIHTNTAPKLGLGSANFAGDLAEFMVFNRVLANSERGVVGMYLNHKYLFVTNAPNVPAGVLITALSSNELNVTWTNVSSLLGVCYVLDRKVSSGGTYAELANVWNTTSYLDSATEPAINYIYRIKAKNYLGQSAYSSEISPPTAVITNPATSGIFTIGSSHTIGADLTDSDGSITQAVFYVGLLLTGTDTSSPFSATWSNPLQGSYRLWVKAWDNSGNTRISRFRDVWISLDTDGDGVNDFIEIAQGTNPAATDTDGDGVSDATDVFPLDPNRSSLPGADGTPPVITLEEPAEATLIP
jgi:Big-like domain-containing protein/fibronectin type III domain protein